MRRQSLTILGLALALAMAAPAVAAARSYFGFQIGVGNAPPPRVWYVSPPPEYYVPEYGVYVVRDGYDGCDEFQYGPYWYVCNGDYWYRARSYRGPFVGVDVRAVPRQVFYVPARHWRRYPPGLARWRGEHREEWRGDQRDRDDQGERGDRGEHGRGRGRGHGRGHDRD